MKKIEGKYNPKDFEEKYINLGKKRNKGYKRLC